MSLVTKKASRTKRGRKSPPLTVLGVGRVLSVLLTSFSMFADTAGAHVALLGTLILSSIWPCAVSPVLLRRLRMDLISGMVGLCFFSGLTRVKLTVNS